MKGVGLPLKDKTVGCFLSPVSIQFQTQSLALRALRKRKSQETQALALASSQSWLPLLRPSIPIGWRLRLLRENTLAFLAVFVYATHATQAIAFEWKPGLTLSTARRSKRLVFLFLACLRKISLAFSLSSIYISNHCTVGQLTCQISRSDCK